MSRVYGQYEPEDAINHIGRRVRQGQFEGDLPIPEFEEQRAIAHFNLDESGNVSEFKEHGHILNRGPKLAGKLAIKTIIAVNHWHGRPWATVPVFGIETEEGSDDYEAVAMRHPSQVLNAVATATGLPYRFEAYHEDDFSVWLDHDYRNVDTNLVRDTLWSIRRKDQFPSSTRPTLDTLPKLRKSVYR